jgi:hypothetical protein
MTAGESTPFESFRAIRDKALLIGLGSAYLCEPPFLARYGAEVERALSFLERDIRGLKGRFPGRSRQEADTDRILDGLRDLAVRMREADPALRKECAAGQLGTALEGQLKALSDAVQEVRRQVDGEPARYSGTEAVTGTFRRAAHAVLGGFGVLGKAVGVVLLALIVAFGYLFVTMERETGLEKEIAAHRRQIQVLKEDLSRLEQESIGPLELRIRQLEREGSGRADKLRKLELSVELGKLEQRAASLRGEIKQHRMGIQAAEASLESLKRKGFFARLLRQ